MGQRDWGSKTQGCKIGAGEGGGGGGYWYDCVSAVTARYDEWPADTTVQPNANISIVYTLPSVIHHCFCFFLPGQCCSFTSSK